MKLSKRVLAAIAAAVLLGALVGTASARSFSSTSSTFRSTFREVKFVGVFGNIICELTLEGTFHSRTFAKVVGSLVGYITSANLGPCAEGTATILRETLPWHGQYGSFQGPLPMRIEAIKFRIIGMSIRVREPVATCLARTTAAAPAIYGVTRGAAEGALTTASISGTGIPIDCGGTGSFASGAGTITVLNAATRITVTLI